MYIMNSEQGRKLDVYLIMLHSLPFLLDFQLQKILHSQLLFTSSLLIRYIKLQSIVR